MTAYHNLPDTQAEQEIYTQLRAYDDTQRVGYARIGLMALEVEQRELWRCRTDDADGFPCRSFARWLQIACPYAPSTVYAALGDVREIQDMPAEVIAEIPQSNMKTVKQLSTATRRDEAVLKAATQKNDVFVAHLAKHHPDQHISSRGGVRVTCEDPEMVYSVLDQAVELHDAQDRGHALEMVCAMARRTWELESEVAMSIQHESKQG